MVNFLEQMLGGTPGDPFLGTGLKDAISGGGGGLPSGLKAFFGDTGALSPKFAFGGTALGNNADLRRVLGLPAQTPGGAVSPQQAQRLAVAAGVAPGAPATNAPAAPGTAAFFQQHLPYAQQAATAAGWSAALAPVMLGIAVNEGAAAQGTLANAPYNNVFGIKATPDWQGGIVRMPTTEYVNGQPVTQQATFRTYPTPQESYGDFITFLQQNARYGPALQAFQQGSDWRDFVRGLHAAGYATDPNWANKVIGIGEQAQNNQPWVAPTVAAATSSATPFAGAPFEVRFGFDQPYGTPLAGGTTHHRGVDIVPVGGGIGAPVTALRAGTVVAFQQGGEQGNAVVLQDADGLYNAYFHLLDPNSLTPGTRVEAGQQINRMGQSGSEGFPHLHLEVRRRINGDPRGAVINPLTYFGLGQ